MTFLEALGCYRFITSPTLQELFGKDAYIYDSEKTDGIILYFGGHYVSTDISSDILDISDWLESSIKNKTDDEGSIWGIKFKEIQRIVNIGFLDRNFNDISSVAIPDGITKIKDEAFDNCTNIKSVTIPNSVTEIGWSAFSSCINLDSVIIPDSVDVIWDYAFSYCESLRSIVIPEGVHNFGESTFCGCTSLESVILPKSLKNIGYNTFEGCENLRSLTISRNCNFERNDVPEKTSIILKD